MWFIIRATFCIGVVFSMTPGGKGLDELRETPAAMLAAVAGPGMRELVEGALASCKNEPKPCLLATRQLAGIAGDRVTPLQEVVTTQGARLVADTLTAADRAPAWHGKPRKPQAPAQLREAMRPAT